MVMVLLILELRKIKREMGMAVQSNKTESNGETACDETEKPEGLSEMPERGNHPIKYFQANPYSLLQKLGWMRK